MISAISLIGLTAPVSLLTAITETKIVSSVIAALIELTSICPFSLTGKMVNLKPSSSKDFITFKTEGCSVAVVIKWLPLPRLA